MLDIDKIKESARFIEQNISERPQTAIVLGSGLGGLVEEIQNRKEIAYKDIPNFPVSTVQGHRGTLIFGTLNGTPVLVMSGRFHYYEGYSMQTLTFPIQVFSQLGIKKIILSNAAGGLNPSFDIADIMIITDHINLMANNPLLGPNNDQLGPRSHAFETAPSNEKEELLGRCDR